MATAVRGRRPLVGVLGAGGGGTPPVSSFLRNARGRLFPGVLIAVGGSALGPGESVIAQRTPSPTQAATVAWTELTAAITQTVPSPRQTVAVQLAASTTRAVRLTYLVLEVPDPPLTATIAQTTPSPTQAAVMTNSADDRLVAIAQTTPSPTQAAEADYMSKSNVFENDWLKLVFQATPIATLADNAATNPLTNLYVALHSSDPGESGVQSTNEVAYTSYARVAVARSAAGWTITNNSVSPAANIDFPACTGSTATATHFSVGTESSGTGKVLYKGTVTPNISISNGVTPRLTTATVITED